METSKRYSITVLMSTYNGRKYLKEQMDSILSQEGVNLQLVIRDDGSNDDTVAIIKDYQKRFTNIKLINDGKNKGAKNKKISYKYCWVFFYRYPTCHFYSQLC